MTEKRFSYMEQFNGFCDVYDTGKILSCMRLEYVDKTVNLLNEQHETIQVLKASNGEMEDYLARLEEENEQLKSENEDLKIDISVLNRHYDKYEKICTKLERENEELKQALNRNIEVKEFLLEEELKLNDTAIIYEHNKERYK